MFMVNIEIEYVLCVSVMMFLLIICLADYDIIFDNGSDANYNFDDAWKYCREKGAMLPVLETLEDTSYLIKKCNYIYFIKKILIDSFSE